jgi:hypothetical protein
MYAAVTCFTPSPGHDLVYILLRPARAYGSIDVLVGRPVLLFLQSYQEDRTRTQDLSTLFRSLIFFSVPLSFMKTKKKQVLILAIISRPFICAPEICFFFFHSSYFAVINSSEMPRSCKIFNLFPSLVLF